LPGATSAPAGALISCPHWWEDRDHLAMPAKVDVEAVAVHA
jgi:hypothetical protein